MFSLPVVKIVQPDVTAEPLFPHTYTRTVQPRFITSDHGRIYVGGGKAPQSFQNYFQCFILNDNLTTQGLSRYPFSPTARISLLNPAMTVIIGFREFGSPFA